MNLWPACTNCGESHGPIVSHGALCDMAEGEERVNRYCPYHKQEEPGRQVTYYDTVRVFFDCGTFADYGYGEWSKPEAVIKAERHEAYLRRKARKAAQAGAM